MSSDGDPRPPQQVTDPDDFNRTQRFKEIHDARQRVTDHIAEMELGDGANRYNTLASKRLAYLIALYVAELEPLIEQADIDDEELVPDSSPFNGLREFVAHMGVSPPNSERGYLSPQALMKMFGAANRFYAKVGLDLELEEDDGDAGFDYSDILEEGPPGSGTSPPQIETDGGSQ